MQVAIILVIIPSRLSDSLFPPGLLGSLTKHPDAMLFYPGHRRVTNLSQTFDLSYFGSISDLDSRLVSCVVVRGSSFATWEPIRKVTKLCRALAGRERPTFT